MSEEELEGWRKKIDECDQEILIQLSKRSDVAKQIMDWKRNRSKPLLDSEREQLLINSLVDRAKDLNVDSNMIRDLYEVILKYSKEL